MSKAHIMTVAFSGVNAIKVDVQVHIGAGLPFFTIVGLPDKSIGEAKERIRAVFNSLGISLPPKRITVNMSPASLQKEGSHYDLPIALGILVATGVISQDSVDNWVVLGELSLDGSVESVPGILMAAMFANSYDHILVCPFSRAKEARIAGRDFEVFAIKHLMDLISFTRGEYSFPVIMDYEAEEVKYSCDMEEVAGQEFAKRGFEIAAAGNLHVLLIGPPGVGKSMLAKRLITILPELNAVESLEVSMIYSIANKSDAKLKRKRPYREPHHSASLVALVGGGAKAMPGEISLAHNGVLFLDELAEYTKALEGLRQSMESGEVTVSRAQKHVTYPAKAQIVAAMNPCKCGYLGTSRQCRRAPICGQEYQNKISGPIMDRFDLVIYMDCDNNFYVNSNEEKSDIIKSRVISAINFQAQNYEKQANELKISQMNINDEGMNVLIKFCESKQVNKRSFMKTAKIARIIANLESSSIVKKKHILEAIMYRKFY